MFNTPADERPTGENDCDSCEIKWLKKGDAVYPVHAMLLR